MQVNEFDGAARVAFKGNLSAHTGVSLSDIQLEVAPGSVVVVSTMHTDSAQDAEYVQQLILHETASTASDGVFMGFPVAATPAEPMVDLVIIPAPSLPPTPPRWPPLQPPTSPSPPSPPPTSPPADDVHVWPNRLLKGVRTEVVFLGTLPQLNMFVTFLPAGDSSCDGALAQTDLFGVGGSISGGRLTLARRGYSPALNVTLSDPVAHKLCANVDATKTPSTDAEFRFVQGVLVQ
eukprot:3394100-Prymnesium_polylepis.1